MPGSSSPGRAPSDPGEGSPMGMTFCAGEVAPPVSPATAVTAGVDAPNRGHWCAAGSLAVMSDDWLYGGAPGGRKGGDAAREQDPDATRPVPRQPRPDETRVMPTIPRPDQSASQRSAQGSDQGSDQGSASPLPPPPATTSRDG